MPAAQVIEQIDPRSLLIDQNIRQAAPDRDLVASIKDLGVLQPVVGYRTAGGPVRVRFGHRRTLAAIEAGRATVPVIVAGDEAADDTAAIERLLGQHAENTQRQGLSTADEIGVVASLLDLGVKAGTIQRRLRGLPKGGVQAVQAITGSQTALAAVAETQLTLDQLAAIAEFDGDQQAVSLLIDAANQGDIRFRHRLQELRDARRQREQVTAKRAELASVGVTTLDDEQHPGWDCALTNLADADGNPITDEAHQACPGHVATVHASWYDDELRITCYCADPDAFGHTRRTRPGSDSDETTPEQKARQRRETIANNKAWRAATTVRRDWLTDFLARTKAPAGAQRVIIRALADGSPSLRRQMERAHQASRPLLGLPDADTFYGPGRLTALLAAIYEASETRATMIALGLVLAAYEDVTHPDMQKNPGVQHEAASYFKLLTGWGYQLAECEQLIVTAVDAHAAERATGAVPDGSHDGGDESAA